MTLFLRQRPYVLTCDQAYLHLLLKISESVTRLESLLLIASTDSPTSPPLKTMSLSNSLSTEEDGPEDR